MRQALVIVGFLAFSIGACGKPEPEAPPVLIENSQVESKLHWSSELEGKRVSIDGFIAFDNGRNGEAIAMGPHLNSQSLGAGRNLIAVQLERGEGANQLNLPVLTTETMPGMPGAPKIVTFDLGESKFQDAAGAPHPLSRKVRATGRLRYAQYNRTGIMSDEDKRSPSGRRYRPRLTEVSLESPPPR
jgi:hypothetical protein